MIWQQISSKNSDCVCLHVGCVFLRSRLFEQGGATAIWWGRRWKSFCKTGIRASRRQDVQPASSYLVCVFLLCQDTNSLPIMNQRQLLAWLLVVASWRCMHKTALGQSLIAQLLPRLHDAGVTNSRQSQKTWDKATPNNCSARQILEKKLSSCLKGADVQQQKKVDSTLNDF